MKNYTRQMIMQGFGYTLGAALAHTVIDITGSMSRQLWRRLMKKPEFRKHVEEIMGERKEVKTKCKIGFQISD